MQTKCGVDLAFTATGYYINISISPHHSVPEHNTAELVGRRRDPKTSWLNRWYFRARIHILPVSELVLVENQSADRYGRERPLFLLPPPVLTVAANF
jgi:hypothetical protein